jgi:hypothetical protein
VSGVISYLSMAEMLAVHYGANGVPTRVATKSVGTAFALVFVQIGVTALLVGIAAAAFFRSRPDIDPAHPVSSARWHRQYMSLGAKALLKRGDSHTENAYRTKSEACHVLGGPWGNLLQHKTPGRRPGDTASEAARPG